MRMSYSSRLSPTLCLLLGLTSCGSGSPEPQPRRVEVAGYVSDSQCIACHGDQAGAWAGSHHDLAMQVASPASILGDFEDALFDDGHIRARFSRRGDEYFCRIEGPDGDEHDYPIGYTFGVEPLQQYMIAFPGGRLQCLTVAWDTEAKRWFSLYPEDDFEAGDPLHWSGRQQNWNTMCADCHSTHLSKNYDLATDSFDTTWAEINVGCQACHGPGEGHLAWLEKAASGETGIPDKGLTTTISRGHPKEQVRACAPCHSRRLRLEENISFTGDYHDAYMLELLSPGSYHADGQIDGEVYVLGSFLQSKMHGKGVTCSDCHDPHSLQLVAEGNALCLQCHSPYAPLERFSTLTKKDYDSPEHHFHSKDSAGASCVDCHMPSKKYMLVDPRHDHSFRVPRPDLSLAHGTPNACNQCHTDQDAEWAAEKVTEWYGPRKAETFEDTLTRAHEDLFGTREELVALSMNSEAPGIARATALELSLNVLPHGLEERYRALEDPDPLVRLTALRGLEVLPPPERLEHVLPRLSDPVRSVRIQAARALADIPAREFPSEQRAQLKQGLDEFERVQLYSADMPAAHLNLGVLRASSGDLEAAVKCYRKALELDPWFLMARFNLATTLSVLQRSPEAVELLQEGIELAPDEPEMHYSLGLALAELGRMEEAIPELRIAADALPEDARKQYNAGLALQKLQKHREAETYLLRGHRRSPRDPEILHAVVLLMLQTKELERARAYAIDLNKLCPGGEAKTLIDFIDRKIQARTDEAAN